MPGSFKIAKKAKCPIVPVVLYDSFKPFERMVTEACDDTACISGADPI